MKDGGTEYSCAVWEKEGRANVGASGGKRRAAGEREQRKGRGWVFINPLRKKKKGGGTERKKKKIVPDKTTKKKKRVLATSFLRSEEKR